MPIPVVLLPVPRELWSVSYLSLVDSSFIPVFIYTKTPPYSPRRGICFVQETATIIPLIAEKWRHSAGEFIYICIEELSTDNMYRVWCNNCDVNAGPCREKCDGEARSRKSITTFYPERAWDIYYSCEWWLCQWFAFIISKMRRVCC